MLPVLTSLLKRHSVHTAAFSTLLKQCNSSDPDLCTHSPAVTGWQVTVSLSWRLLGLSFGPFFTFLNLHVMMNSLPEAPMQRNVFWLFIDVNKIQFPAEILSSALESASFLDISWRCSQPGLPAPSQDFGVKEQSC